MNESTQYVVRDAHGNLYGPAGGELLREWVREGRIIAGMGVSRADNSGTAAGPWVEASLHPELTAEFARLPALPSNAATTATGTAGDFAGAASPGDVGTGFGEVRRVGEPPGPSAFEARRRGFSTTLPMVSLVMGAVSLVASPFACCACVSLPAALAAIATGALSLVQARAAQDPSQRQWLSIAGLSLGLLAVLVTILVLVLAIHQGMKSAAGL